MLETFVYGNVWLAMFFWGLVYLSDYYLTIYAARHYHDALGNFMHYEGSYELTPAFQKDIDTLNPFSRAFYWRWLFSLVLIYAVYWVARILPGGSLLYSFLLGGLFIRELVIHMRHARTISLIWLAKKPGAIRGSVEYSRWLNLRLSAVELVSFGLFFLLLAIFTSSWFFFGGALITAITGFQHWLYTRKMTTVHLGS